MSLAPGTRVGLYEVVALIGAGGMGEVYRARDLRLKREIALKILPPSFAADPDRLVRFQREAELLASLNHPNIAAIYGLEESDGVRALVLELVDGETLADRIARGPIPVEEALALARQITEALEAAHEHGIVHRDLKPANVKIRADSTVKVLDFGLAKALEPAGAAAGSDAAALLTQSPTLSFAATQAGVILGTVPYMAPEQARGRAADRRADIWAFGCVLYEMITGRRAFDGRDISETLAAVLRLEPDWRVLAGVSPGLETLLRRCLEKEPKRRLRDIGDVWILLDSGTPARAEPHRSRSILRVSAAALVLGVVAAAAIVWSRGPAQRAAPVVFLEYPPAGTEFVRAPLPSPDGRHLAMLVRDQQGQTQIWVRALTEDRARALEPTKGATLLFWSPDSQALGFATEGELRRVDRDGGAAQLVAAVGVAGDGGVWTRQGSMVVITRTGGIVRVSAAGGSPQTIEQREGVQYVEVGPLNDSRLVYRELGDASGVYALDLDGSRRTRLIAGGALPAFESDFGFLPPDLLAYTSGGLLLAQRITRDGSALLGEPFPIAEQVRRNGFEIGPARILTLLQGEQSTVQPTWLDRRGAVGGRVGDAGVYEEVLLSPDGRTLLFVRADPVTRNRDLWVQDISSNVPVRFSVNPEADHGAVFSGDGRHIAWEAHSSGTLNVMRRPVDGSAPATVVREWGRGGGPADWSPDGRFLLYRSNDGGATGMNLWLLPAAGAAEPTRVLDTPFTETDGKFSPDGRYVAYVSDETDRFEVYVQGMEGARLTGRKWRISVDGGTNPQWRRDGRELFFVSKGTLTAAAMASDGAVLRPGTPVPLFSVSASRQGGSETRYAVAPDGQRFLVLTPVAQGGTLPATVTLNWTPQLQP